MPLSARIFNIRPVALALLAALLAFALPGKACALESLSQENPKYLRIKSVYDSVARAFGDGRIPPRLIVVPAGSQSRNVVAWSDPGTEGAIGIEAEGAPLQEGYIALEEKVDDLFAALGEERDDALAFLLGHELTHYYLRHGWVGEFGNSFASTEMGRKMLKAAGTEEVIRLETEADYFGGFYGYLAGYDTLGVAPRALELIYASYKLPDRLPNYPARPERKAIAERAQANLSKMAPVFDAATRLLLLEQYAEAARLFEHLAHNFPSREMFNNAGVAYALEALRLSRPGTGQFAYPFEIDAQTRLNGKRTRTKGIGDPNAERRRRLFNLAADCFEKALKRDQGYATASVNLAAANALLGDHDSAVILANKAMTLARAANETTSLANALTVRGIAYAESGNRERAAVDLAAARNLNSPLAALNLALLQGEGAQAGARQQSEAAGAERETIGGVSPLDPFLKGAGTNSFSLQGVDRGEPAIQVHARQQGEWEDTLIAVGGKLNRVLSTGKGYGGRTARGIGIGSSEAELRRKYGEPSGVISAVQGGYSLYRKSGVIFALDQEQKVKGWSLFATQQ